MEVNNYPVYLNEVLVPQHLDLTIEEYRLMPYNTFKYCMDQIRAHFVDLIDNKNYAIFGDNNTLSEVIFKLKKLDDTDGCRLYEHTGHEAPGYQSNLFDGALQYSSDATKAINHWAPELFSTPRANGRSVNDQFYDSKQFYNNVDAIIFKDRFKFFQKNPKMRISKALKEGLRLVNGNQPCYNYPPYLAKWIVTDVAKRIPQNQTDFYILDSSTGWYGRLAGVLGSCNSEYIYGKTVHYYTTDVNKSIDSRFKSIIEFWRERINSNISFRGYKSTIPSEEILSDPVIGKMKRKFDLALTSVPYHDTERYSDDPGQSYKRYPIYDDSSNQSWKNGFLKPTIENTYELLKHGGEYWLNIADIKCKDKDYGLEYYTLEDDAVELAKEAGFRHAHTYLMLSPLLANFKSSVYSLPKNHVFVEGKKFKFEPILVFIKPGGSNEL